MTQSTLDAPVNSLRRRLLDDMTMRRFSTRLKVFASARAWRSRQIAKFAPWVGCASEARVETKPDPAAVGIIRQVVVRPLRKGQRTFC